MGIDWQQVIIGLLLCGAVAYLIVYAVWRRRKRDKCEDCALLGTRDREETQRHKSD